MIRLLRALFSAPEADPEPFNLDGPICGPRDQYIADQIAKAKRMDAQKEK